MIYYRSVGGKMNDTIKKILIVIVGVVLQFGFLIGIQLFFTEKIALIGFFYEIASILIILAILKDSTRLSHDIPWLILILLFPIFGIILFMTLGRSYSKSKLSKSIIKYEKINNQYLIQDEGIKNEINSKDLDNLKYILNNSGYPIHKDNEVTYYPFGEDFYPELLKELKKAKKFIFMEYFIINKGIMWDEILDILKEKSLSGVDVRIIYDDMGSLTTLPPQYSKELADYKIKCISFNELSPFKGVFMNNRDHRKMTVIDGRVAFSGGVNISDEYINLKLRLGIWKDNGIKIVGSSVWNFTVMFLTMWNAHVNEDKDISHFKYQSNNKNRDNGFIVPYGISPNHKDLVGEDIYINMINSAKKYLYIMTPYLIIDTDMVNSLIRASKRGVDVRIVIPGIPDKKIVYAQTNSFFTVLNDGGVKIYRYEPGFIHSKVFLSDDNKAVVGTINMDYRSLYLHFENGIYMEDVYEIKDIKNDFEETFSQSKQLDDEDIKPGFIKNIWYAILRLLAPLF